MAYECPEPKNPSPAGKGNGAWQPKGGGKAGKGFGKAGKGWTKGMSNKGMGKGGKGKGAYSLEPNDMADQWWDPKWFPDNDDAIPDCASIEKSAKKSVSKYSAIAEEERDSDVDMPVLEDSSDEEDNPTKPNDKLSSNSAGGR